MSLISLQAAKTFMHLTESEMDTLLQDIIDGEIATAEDQIHQVLEEATTTEYHDGNRTNTLVLANGHVTGVTSVKIDYNDDGVYEYEMDLNDDYVWYEEGLIVLRSAKYFPEGIKNIEVIYTHGYDSETVAATNLPTDEGFIMYEDRPTKVCTGIYSGLASIVINSAADGAGTTYAENTDYVVMALTGEVVILSTGSMTDGNTYYIESGTYTERSNLPKDLRLTLLKMIANTFNATFVETEAEGDEKKFSQKVIDKVLGKYTRKVIA